MVEVMTLREIYVADLNQLLEATRQKLLEWPVMAARAQAPMLRDAFDEHYAQTRAHLDTLAALFERLDERPRQLRADVFHGVLDLWRSRHRDQALGDIRELSLISAAMAADYHTRPIYAEALTAARSLGDLEGAHRLQAIMNDERDRTHRLTLFHDWLATRLSGGVDGDRWAAADSNWSAARAASTVPGLAAELGSALATGATSPREQPMT
jgi:ferritin-like metal-binding protein YciE